MRRITYWLAVIFIFIVPWEDSISVTSLGSVARIMGLVMSAFWLITILIDGRFRIPHPFHVLVLLLFLWNFVSVFWSPNVDDTVQRIKTYSQIFILMLIYWEMFQKPEDLAAGLQAYIYGTYVLIASTIYNYIKGNVAVEYEGRYSATGVNAVDLTLILMLGLPVALHLFFKAGLNNKGILTKLVNLAYIPLSLFAIILTGSRTSLIAVIPFGLYLVGTHQIKSSRKVLIFSILIISLLILIPFIPRSVTARLSTLVASIEAGDLGGRGGLWWQTILVFSNHPFIGLGSGALDSVIGSAAHNTFLSIATETGFIGFVLFVAILVIVFFQALKIPNGDSGLWVAVFLTWVIGVSSLSWEFRKLTWLLLNFIVIESNFVGQLSSIRQHEVENQKRMQPSLRVNQTGIKARTE